MGLLLEHSHSETFIKRGCFGTKFFVKIETSRSQEPLEYVNAQTTVLHHVSTLLAMWRKNGLLQKDIN